MTALEFTAVPPGILALVEKPPLLKGESAQEYYDLLGGLVSDIIPADCIEWLWVIQFTNCSWEIFRNRRYRAILIDLQRGQALRSVILKTSPSQQMTGLELERAFALWTENPGQFAQHGVDPQSVPATALLQAAKNLEIIEPILERLQRRCDSILQQLEHRRELFAYRARHAADRVLNVESVEIPNIPTAKAPPALAPPEQAASQSPSQTTAEQSVSDEVTIVPASPDAGGPNSEEVPPETSDSNPSVVS